MSKSVTAVPGRRFKIRIVEGCLVDLVEHLESYLGEIEFGWDRDADGDEMPFHVVLFPRGCGDSTVSFATLGLSQYPLESSSGEKMRHELLMIVPEQLRDGPVPGLLLQIGMEALTAGRPLLRGEVIGPRGTLIAGSAMEAVYVALPVYFPDEFAVYEDGDGPIVVSWLVPISAKEAKYVNKRGWEAFEDRLVESNPDLTNIFRPSLSVR